MSLYIFYFLAFLAVFSALMVVFSRNPIYSVLYLVITFFSVGGHYLLLSAEFLFAVHIIVYAGAIMVLFLYVIMLMNLNKESEAPKKTLYQFAAVISAGLLMMVVVGAVRGAEQAQIGLGANPALGTVKNLGSMLFNEFLLPFEVVSVLLLAAMVGAVMLGRNPLRTRRQSLKGAAQTRPSHAADVKDAPIENVKQLTNE